MNFSFLFQFPLIFELDLVLIFDKLEHVCHLKIHFPSKV